MSRPHSSSVDADTTAWGGVAFDGATSVEYSPGNGSGHVNMTDARTGDDEGGRELNGDMENAASDQTAVGTNNARRDDDETAVADREKLIDDIVNKQDGLKALLQRITHVQTENSKLKSNNETLQTYIDNLTRANALGAMGPKR
ncbi:hypothetical protein OIV83_002775 [Microbotryomycetes sp. JL201]|nr:hypothetical protein OIV83_002775 [Microbotryomycetes sp. JL201]